MLKFSGFLISGTAPQGVTTSVRSRGGSPPLVKLARLLQAVSRTVSASRHRAAAARTRMLPPSRLPARQGGPIVARRRRPLCKPRGDAVSCRPPQPAPAGGAPAPRTTSGGSKGEALSLEYLLARIGQLLLIVFIAVTVNFLIPRAIPGDPIENALQTRIAMTGSVDVNVQEIAAAYRAKFGLDKPLWLQYLYYWRDIFRLDLGVSLVDFPQPVISKVRGALPWTLGLLGVSTLIDFTLGTLLGALAAWP